MAWFQVSFFSECLSRSVPLNVLIPADNFGPASMEKEKGEDSFKTLYLLHGFAGSASHWLLNASVNEMATRYNIAIVMPSGYNGDYVDQPTSGVLGSTFLGRELVDFTRRLFPLSGNREDTILGGLSMGGYGTLYNALRFNEVFGHAIALSAPNRLLKVAAEDRAYFEMLHGDIRGVMETDRNLELSAKTLLQSGRPLPDLYIACGYNDLLVRDNRAYSAYLTSIGFPHTYEEGPGTHAWAFWDEFLQRGLGRITPERLAARRNPFWIEKDDNAKGVSEWR